MWNLDSLVAFIAWFLGVDQQPEARQVLVPIKTVPIKTEEHRDSR